MSSSLSLQFGIFKLNFPIVGVKFFNTLKDKTVMDVLKDIRY